MQATHRLMALVPVARRRLDRAGAALRDLAARPAARVAGHALVLALLLAATAAYARHVLRTFGSHTIDDAGITYAYADNLGRGRGVRLTPGEAPVEGFSNPLEVLLLAPAVPFVKDIDPVAKAVNVGLCAAGLLSLGLLIYRRARGGWRLSALAPVLLAFTWTGFNYWTAAGLEGGILAGVQMGTLLALVLAPAARPADIALGILAGLLCWCRPEAAVYGAIAVAARAVRRPRRWLAPAIYLGVFGLLMLGRYVLFRDVVANTFWAKVKFNFDPLAGWSYLGEFFRERAFYFATPLPVLAFLTPATRWPAAAAAAQMAFGFYFPVYAGGDWMYEWRFVQPVMGPWAALCALGVLGALEARPPVLRRWWARGALLALALTPPLVIALRTPTWAARAAQLAAPRNLPMSSVTLAGNGYARNLPRWTKLQRPPLVADVDVGGLSYHKPLDVMDLSGLTDRVLARGWTWHAGLIVDYLFGERRPDTIHIHGGWFTGTPVPSLSPFRQYRALGAPALTALARGPLTAIRADLLDPPAAPVQRLQQRIRGGLLVGVSAVATGKQVVLAGHVRQTGVSDPANLAWVDRLGKVHVAEWHAGVELAPGPVGGAALGLAHLPLDALPITLRDTPLRIERWPFVETAPATVDALTRLQVGRLAGVPSPPCDPTPFLDPAADRASRARGVGFIARLCQGLPPERREAWTDQALAAARASDDPDDRYEAAAAAVPIGLPQSIGLRVFIEKARERHQPYDELLADWAHELLARDTPTSEELARALGLLLAARQYESVLTLSLLEDPARPGLGAIACHAARRLGLRPQLIAGGLTCGPQPLRLPAVLRQSFEDPADPRLTFVGSARRWLFAGTRDGQIRVAGGQGRLFLNTFGGPAAPPSPVGEVIWGPLRPPGRHFGALVAGDRGSRVAVVVEAKKGTVWKELARLPSHGQQTVMSPVRMDLPPLEGEVRVRVIDGVPGPRADLLVDALTFVGD
jgi:hypothetical protein